MDPLPNTLTGYSQWTKADTPRTHDLSHLRAKRVAYYESIGIIKMTRNGCQPLSAESQDTEVSPSDYQTFGQRYTRSLATGKKLLLEEGSRQEPQEMEKHQNLRLQEGSRREICPEGLDLRLLSDALVSKTQKLNHIINWAHEFLSNFLEEHDLKSLQKHLELTQACLCQSSKAIGDQKITHFRSSEYPLVLRDDQLFSVHADIPSFFLHPPNDFSEMSLSSEIFNSIPKEGFPVSHSYGWQEVRNEGDGRPDSPDSLQLEESPQEKSDRAGNSHTQNISEDDQFLERPVVLTQPIHTSEINTVLEQTRDTGHKNDYFWTPLTDDSEEEDLDKPGESKETLRRGILGRNYRTLSGIAFPSASNNSTLVSNCTTLSGGVSSSGETPLETAVKEECRGATESPVGTDKDISVEFMAGREHLIQRLPGDQLMCLIHHSDGKREELDKEEFTLGPTHTENKHESDWKQGSVESPGEAIMERVPGGQSNQTAWDSAYSIPPGITQKHFIMTHPESCLSPESARLLLNVSEGPWDNAAPHAHLGSGVCCGLCAHTDGIGRSTWFDQLPAPVLDGRSVQTPQRVAREIPHEPKQTAFCSNHPISQDISKTSLKRSSTPQNIGASLSRSGEPLPKAEQGSSVLETYFYYLHMLNKIRGASSEERNSSLPLQGPSMTKAEPVITSPRGKDRFNWMKRDRETKEQRKGNENDVAVEDKEGTCHQGQDCMQEAALEKASPWKLHGSHGRSHSAMHRLTYRNCRGNLEKPDSENSSHVLGYMDEAKVTLGGAQGLLLALQSGITPGKVQGSMWDTGD